MIKEKILSELGPVFDTHEHFGYYGEYSPKEPDMDLATTINCAYLPIDMHLKDYKAICEQLKKYIGSSRFIALRLAYKNLFGIDIYPLSPKKLEDLDKEIQDAYASDPEYTFKILENKGNVKHIIHDVPPSIWDAWQNQIASHTIRIDDTIFPFVNVKPGMYRPRIKAARVFNFAFDRCLPMSALDDFEDNFDKYINSLGKSVSTIKIGSAYQRSIDFKLEDNENNEIDEIFKKILDGKELLTEKMVIKWSNYVITLLLSFATVEQFPVQIHTGLAIMKRTGPVYLLDIMKAFPSVRFDLFHGGYPFHDTVPGVLMVAPNAWINLCWMPTLSKSATKNLLNDLIDVGLTGRVIGFGGDCRSPEGSLGALILMKQAIADVLAKQVENGQMLLADAVEIADMILFNTADNLYKSKIKHLT
ncbi:MAG: hypothetical protein ACTSWN_09820 [Promethearchaeota archaeon]